MHQVGQPPLEAAEGFFRGLALAPLALVIQAARGGGAADLGDRHHVPRMAGPPVPRPGEAVADLVAGGGADRRGAVVAGDGVLGGEPGHAAGFGQDPPGSTTSAARSPPWLPRRGPG